MSKKTQATFTFRIREEVLISGSQLTQIRRHQAILSEARNLAKKMLQEATLQAEQVRRQAYSDGYRDGVLSAADSV
ncbi:hypothetical protein QN367_19255, partial [Cryobacterium sp. RTS3]|uniref:hypothetical protein n=1 Tax=Cryobacterium sp. RTS3 TaxID=3048643 RepID=UPI002B22EFDB